MRLHEKWPKGHGVDREFWDKQKLWHLADAAAISLGIDPRVLYSDAEKKDPAYHGGPKLSWKQVPGLVSANENLVIMAMNGLLPVLKAGADGKSWYVHPAEYWSAIGGTQVESSDALKVERLWLTGAELLERWKLAPFELLDIMRSGNIEVFTNLDTGKILSKDSDPCFYCTEILPVLRLKTDNESLRVLNGERKICPFLQVPASLASELNAVVGSPMACLWVQGILYNDAEKMPVLEMGEKARRQCQMARMRTASVRLRDVEAYEQAHGLAPLLRSRSDAEASVNTPRAATVADVPESSKDQQGDGYERPFSTDQPQDYAGRLRDRKAHPDEIQYRMYELRLLRWDLRQWQAHCLAKDIPYPPDGEKGESDRDRYGKAYGRARARHLAKIEASKKSEKLPE